MEQLSGLNPSESKSPRDLLHCKSQGKQPVTQFTPCLSHEVCKRSPPIYYTPVFLGFPGGSGGKESACNAGDLGQILKDDAVKVLHSICQRMEGRRGRCEMKLQSLGA